MGQGRPGRLAEFISVGLHSNPGAERIFSERMEREEAALRGIHPKRPHEHSHSTPGGLWRLAGRRGMQNRPGPGTGKPAPGHTDFVVQVSLTTF